MSDPLDTVFEYARYGYPVFALHGVTGGGGCTCGDPECGSQGKHPRMKDWKGAATTDEDEIARMAAQWPGSNWATPTGRPGGLVVFDIDPRNGGLGSAKLLTARNGGAQAIPETVTVQTGGDGYHYCFAVPEGVVVPTRKLKPGVDLKAAGGYVVIPPSVTEKPYRFARGRGLGQVRPAALPDWILQEAQRRTGSAFDFDENGKVGPGQRNTYLTSQGGALRRRAFTPESILAALTAENERRCSPPLERAEVEHIAASVSRYEPASNALISTDQQELDLDAKLDAAASEQAVLGFCMASDDRDLVARALVRLSPESLLEETNRRVLRAMKGLLSRSASTHPANVRAALEAEGAPGAATEVLPALVEAGEIVRGEGDLLFHLGRIEDAHVYREATFALEQALRKARLGGGDPRPLVASVAGRLGRILEGATSEKQVYDTVEALALVDRILDDAKEGRQTMNLPTGFSQFDTDLLGLVKGGLTLVGARPSQGKTAWVLQMMAQQSEAWTNDGEDGVALFFSAEMSAAQVTLRSVSREARIPSDDLRRWKAKGFGAAEQARIDEAKRKILRDHHIIIDQTPSPSGQYMAAKAMAIHAQRPVKVIVFDFLELAGDPDPSDAGWRKKYENKVTQLEETLKTLKEIAKLIGCPVVVLTQLSREVEKRAASSKGSREPIPTLADIRWVGQAEQLAEQVIFLYWPWKFWKSGIPYKVEPDEEHYEAHVAKNRDGKIGVVPFRFVREYGLFLPPDPEGGPGGAPPLRNEVADVPWEAYEEEVPEDLGAAAEAASGLDLSKVRFHGSHGFSEFAAAGGDGAPGAEPDPEPGGDVTDDPDFEPDWDD